MISLLFEARRSIVDAGVTDLAATERPRAADREMELWFFRGKGSEAPAPQTNGRISALGRRCSGSAAKWTCVGPRLLNRGRSAGGNRLVCKCWGHCAALPLHKKPAKKREPAAVADPFADLDAPYDPFAGIEVPKNEKHPQRVPPTTLDFSDDSDL